jgi:hypothetical protein
MITVLVTGADLLPIADPITTWTSVTAEVKHNEVGSGSITVPVTTAITTALTTPGARIVLIRDGAIFSAGPVEKPTEYEWSAKGGGAGLLTAQWADDLILAARRVVYPDPTLAADAQVIEAYAATGTNAETLILDLVNRNVGPGALAARIEPYLTMAAPGGVGTSVDISARFDKLGDKIRDLCTAGGGLGVRITEVAGSLVFSVYAPVDRSATVRFSAGLNNLRSVKLIHEAPVATVAIVGGSGTGAARTIVERIDVTGAAWGRSEIFVSSSQAATTTELEQDGDKALLANGESYTVSAQAVDTADQRFGTHFALSDRVSLTTPHGITVTDVVTAAKLTDTPKTGDVVEITIGSELTAGVDQRTLLLREFERRLGAVERV